MAEWAGRHRDELAGLPHYHVIAETTTMKSFTATGSPGLARAGSPPTWSHRPGVPPFMSR